MLTRAAQIAFLVFISLSAFAMPKGREVTTLQVVTSKIKIHGTSAGTIFSYTNLMFTQVNGKKLVYECVQRGDICPVLEPGETYTADRQGDFIYILMMSPVDKKALPAKFRQVGSW